MKQELIFNRMDELQFCNIRSSSTSGDGVEEEVDASQNIDFFDGVFDYLNNMLMEEEDDLHNKPCMFINSLALQAAEQSFYDLLLPDATTTPSSTYEYQFQPQSSLGNPISCGGKRNQLPIEDHGSKQLAISFQETEPLEVYDSALLCEHVSRLWLQQDSPSLANHVPRDTITINCNNLEQGKKKKMMVKKRVDNEIVVDLTELLLDCGESAAGNDTTSTKQILKKIRKHSSPHGSSSERMAHYFANAMDARLAGTGTDLYRGFASATTPAAQMLTSYKAYITACPFHKMSNIFANKSIAKFANDRDKIHIVDFGILYGFQWPCIIEGLSLKPRGPPRLRITGIDLPQPGLRPAERVEETGRRLADYAKRFSVPFEYHSIAKNWESIQIEDLKINSDEMLVVNSIYRMRNVLDETVVESRPRDAVLKLIRSLNPELFVHGVLNGTYNATYFLTRFREAVFHFTTLFDMFDATGERQDKDRWLFEREVLGRDIMNVVACEGRSRVERPEMYRKWGTRNKKVGFQQLPLLPELLEEVKGKVKKNYHQDFLVDQDGEWMLQGWKGRLLYALSLWTPCHRRSGHKSFEK